MAKGICINFDKPCPLAHSGEIQEADESDFVCKECGLPLDPVTQGPDSGGDGIKSWVKYLIGAVLLGGIGCGAYFGLSSKDDTANEELPIVEVPEPVTTAEPTPSTVQASVVVKPTEASDTVGKSVQLQATITPEGEKVVWSSSDDKIAVVDESGKVTLKKAGKAVITCTLNDTVKAVSVVTSVKANDAYDIGFGIYRGPVDKDGVPHGYGGEVKVTRPYYIVLLDGEKLNVSRGDKIVNCKFHRGKLVQGYLKRANGEGRDFMTGVVA